MINQKKRLLNTLNRKLLTGFFVFCLAVAAGTIGCSDSGGGKSKTGYHLSGYDGVVSETSGAQQSLVSAIGNENLKFYAAFPWFVNLTYQAFDKDHLGIADLTVDNFTVLEDGVEVSKLESEMNIRKRDALPSGYSYGIKTVLFLDNTPSSSVTLEKMLEAGQVIVDNLDEKGQQKVAIVSYDESGEYELVQDFTSSVTDLSAHLSLTSGIQPSYGTTNFYSAVIDSLSLWEDNHSPANPDFQQGFLVAVTDGKDTTSLSNVAAAIAARGDKQVIVVAVGNDIPESILNDLERLGNGGFYHVTDPLLPADEKSDKNENLCENILEVQNRMMAYADGFYWLRYKSPITSGNANSTHTVVLSVVNNRNVEVDSTISGTFNSDAFFSGEPNIYFNTSASDPDGITEKVIMIERGQGAGEVAETIRALTFMQSGYDPSKYEWTSGNNGVVTVIPDSTTSAKATVTVVGPGDTILTVKDTVNNVTQTLMIKVKVREESFEMIKHIVTSKEPWFADATFQVRKTDPENNQWDWTTDLMREDMTVMENALKIDMEVSEVHIRKRDNIPSGYSYALKTVLLIDNSPSARNVDNLPLIKQAAKAFVKRVLISDPLDNTDLGPLLDVQNKNQQEIAVVSYDESGETMLVQDFTADLTMLNAVIDGIDRGFGPIDFYGGMLDSLNLWDNDQSPYDAANTDFVQGVVIVLSDGWQSNPGFYDKQAVLDERDDKQIICVSVGNDLVSGNSEDLVDFGNDGFYSVPNPGQTITVTLTPDSGQGSKTVTYTALTKTLMDIQNEVVDYANSFYWLDYKSYLPPVVPCRDSESLIVTINNNSNTGTGKNVTGAFTSCQFFEGNEGAIYVNSTVTDPDGIKAGEEIDLRYVMLGDIALDDPTFPLEAFTYKHVNTPEYEWLVANQNIVRVTPDPRSYANSRATLSLPNNKQQGTTSLRIDDTGNGVFRSLIVNVEGLILPTPIAYYPFNGNADDETGNGYDGTVSGATLTADRFGKAKSAYSFNGTSDYIALEDLYYGKDDGAYSDHIDEITVCAWFKTGYNPGASEYWGRLVDFDGSNYYMVLIHEGHVAFYTNETYSYPIETEDAYNDNAWHFLCATYGAGGKKSIYVDGYLMAQIDVPPGQAIGTGNTKSGFIGSHYLLEMAKFWYFNGQIDDVILFDAELTAAQIQSLWQSFK
ncbi:MAG: LamG-like jellyroll fold domain-containing protein [Desulfosalsimonadaceae bacterium]